MKNLFAKIYAIQKAMPVVTKDSPNPFYKSKYFDINSVIEALRPIINEAGLVVMQPLVTTENGQPAIETMICDPDSGEEYHTITPLIPNTDPQKLGGIITYMRRYALTSMFLIQGEEDDDGNAAASQTAPNAPGSSVAPKAVQSTTPEVCKDCGAAKIMGKKGLYCKPCYIAYVEKKKATELPVIQQENLDNEPPF